MYRYKIRIKVSVQNKGVNLAIKLNRSHQTTALDRTSLLDLITVYNHPRNDLGLSEQSSQLLNASNR